MATVLIVDDEPGVLEGLVRAVSSKGHRTVPCPSLAAARDGLSKYDIDCVLLDIRLKDGDGLDLLKEMRAGPHKETPVIMATAYGDGERTIDAMKSGALLAIMVAVARPKKNGTKVASCASITARIVRFFGVFCGI